MTQYIIVQLVNIHSINEVRGRGKNEQKHRSIRNKKRNNLHLGNSKIDNKETRIQRTDYHIYIYLNGLKSKTQVCNESKTYM